jgi:hypothetical protein
VPVGVAQAGASVTCAHCGQTLEVPGTRQLRLLPVESPIKGSKGEGNRRKSGQGGTFAYRVAVGGLLLATFLALSYGGYLAFLRWNAPIEFGHTEEELYQELYEKSMSDPIVTTWDHWNYLVDAGMPGAPEPPPYFLYSRYYEQQWPWMIGSLAVGGTLFLLFLALTLFGPRGTSPQ